MGSDEILVSALPATSGQRGFAYSSGRGAPANLAASPSSGVSTIASWSALRHTDSINQSGRTGPAQSAQLSVLARQFLSLGIGNYADLQNFIADYPSIVVKSEIDALIAEALTAEKAAESTRAQACIHQALILRECEKIGPRNFDSFFQKMTAREARDAFIRDVKKVYVTIQYQAGRIQTQTERATSKLLVRTGPVISQSTGEVDSPNSYVHARRPQATIQSQTPVARGPDGRLLYTDNRGNLLRPASGRHDSRRHAMTDRADVAGRVVGMELGERHVAPRDASDSKAYQKVITRSTNIPQLGSTVTPRNMCGSAIIFREERELSTESKAVTIGGCLCVDSRYYGFTVAHVLSADDSIPSNPGWASGSPTSKSWEADGDLSELSESDDERSAPSARLRSRTSKSKAKGFSWKFASDSMPWQRVSATSIIEVNGLDLILIPLDSRFRPFENSINFNQSAIFFKTMYPKEVPDQLPADVEYVTVVAGKSGHKRMRLSSSLGGMFLPSAGRVIKVWSVRHEPGALAPGDSGSWVIGDDGELYGYLVGACEMLGASYIAPMATAMAAIRAQSGIRDVSLLGPAISSQTGSEGPNPAGQYGRSRPLPWPGRLPLVPVEEDSTVSTARDPSIEPDIRGMENDTESLDTRYVKRHDAKKFFVVGRVFAFLWHESAGEGYPGREGYIDQTTEGRFGSRVFSHIRRMAVVRERRGYCVCIPIHTYGGQGVLKRGLDQRERQAHSIIHANNTKPAATKEEIKFLVKKPISVIMANEEQKLDKFSRINFAKPQTVEWNVTVMNVGKVAPESIPAFESYWRQETS